MFAVITGKKLVANQYRPIRLSVYMIYMSNMESDFMLNLKYTIHLDEIEKFKNGAICMNFHFKYGRGDTLIFCDKHEIFAFNY